MYTRLHALARSQVPAAVRSATFVFCNFAKHYKVQTLYSLRQTLEGGAWDSGGVIVCDCVIVSFNGTRVVCEGIMCRCVVVARMGSRAGTAEE